MDLFSTLHVSMEAVEHLRRRKAGRLSCTGSHETDIEGCPTLRQISTARTPPRQETRKQVEISPSLRTQDVKTPMAVASTSVPTTKTATHETTILHPRDQPSSSPPTSTPPAASLHTRCHQFHQNLTRKLRTSLNPSSVDERTSIPSNSLDWNNALVRFQRNSSTPRNCEMTSRPWRSKLM